MRSLVAVLLLSSVISCAHVSGPAPDAKIDRVENGLVAFTSPPAMFEGALPADATPMTLRDRMANYKVPGVSVAVVETSRLQWARSWGVVRADAADPVKNDTYFQAASTSKTVAGAIVMHLVDEGRLRLDEDVNSYLRSWRVPENEFTREQKVTLRRLLTHQAGLPSGNFTWKKGSSAPTVAQVLGGQDPATNKPALVEATPGSRWQYSNIGFVVIQQVLEDVTGKPYEEIAQEIVFRPLGMKHSTFDRARLRGTEALPHDETGSLREPQMPPTAVAQGGLMTTPSDLALFAVALMNAYNGKPNPLVSQPMARQLLHKELDLDPKVFGGAFGEGLGVFLHGEGDDLALVSPGSNDPGANCWLVAWPAKGLGVVVMTNGAPGEVLAMEIIAAVHREYGL